MKQRQPLPAIRDTIARVDLVELIRKLHPTGQLKRAPGGEHSCLCPFHKEATASFTIYSKGGRQRFKCFGCGENGDALAFIQKTNQCNAGEALGILNRYLGEYRTGGKSIVARVQYNPAEAEAVKAQESHKAEKVKALAQRWYDEALSYSWDERISVYLLSRSLTPSRHLPFLSPEGQLRLHPGLRHPDTGDTLHPCMLAPVRHSLTGEFLAVHRTYLKPDGSGKAGIEKSKLVLGSARGGAIQLFQPDETLYIAEGIETALSIHQQMPTAAVWAGVSLNNLKSLAIPPQIRQVTLLADNDMKPPEPGKVDPKELIVRYAKAWKAARKGLHVRIAWADAGMDFNDMIKRTASA